MWQQKPHPSCIRSIIGSVGTPYSHDGEDKTNRGVDPESAVRVVGWEPPLDYFLCEIMSLSMNSVFIECWVQPAAAAAAKSLQSCPTLCDPIDGSPPGSAVPGILQARTLEWVAISFSNA